MGSYKIISYYDKDFYSVFHDQLRDVGFAVISGLPVNLTLVNSLRSSWLDFLC